MKKLRTPKQPKRPLKVKVETVAELRPRALGEVAGGMADANCATSKPWTQ